MLPRCPFAIVLLLCGPTFFAEALASEEASRPPLAPADGAGKAPESPSPAADGDSTAATARDYARAEAVDEWLRHPVYGDPSFDAFERVPPAPIHRGAAPFEWPVNVFLLGGRPGEPRHLFIGDYCLGYAARPSRCLAYRSRDGFRSWDPIGVVLAGDPLSFDKGGHTPDVSIVRDGDRYHMVYDWGELNFNQEGGLAHASAESPEGPWKRDAEPITRNTALVPLLGRYQRTYAASLVRRAEDWMILAMMDHAPHSWALFGMRAPAPEGPYSPRVLLAHVERDRFHPPLLEFYPAFVHEGFVYAPATSVARNRNFNCLFRAPIEGAMDPERWEIARHGSVWHAERVESEHFGLWGQTFSGWVDEEETLWAAFPSRDPSGMGTIQLARRAWNRPLRERGFVLTGHAGPSLTLLRRTYDEFEIALRARTHGTVRLLWDHEAPLGPDQPQSDATLHPLTESRHRAFELAPKAWSVSTLDREGRRTLWAAGPLEEAALRSLSLKREAGGRISLAIDGVPRWALDVPPNPRGSIGLWVAPNSQLSVESFEVQGVPRPAVFNYLATEALLGAGESPGSWEDRKEAAFRYGMGFVSREAGARAKWNFTARRAVVWAPRGPDYGVAAVTVDGERRGTIDFRSESPESSRALWRSEELEGLHHALVLTAASGVFPLDSLEVEG